MTRRGFWPQTADHVKGMLSENIVTKDGAEYLELYTGTTWEAFTEYLHEDKVITPEHRDHLFWFTPEFDTARDFSLNGCKSYDRSIEDEDSIVLETRIPLEEIDLTPPPRYSNGVEFHGDERVTCEYPTFAANNYDTAWIWAFHDITEDGNFDYVLLG